MNAYLIVSRCREAGVELSIDGDSLKVRGELTRIASDLLAALKSGKAEVMAYLEKERAVTEDVEATGVLTLSDVPHARLSQAQLDELQREHHDLHRLYITTPMQQGMLYHGMLDGTGASYTSQTACELVGELDESLLRRAWQHVVD